MDGGYGDEMLSCSQWKMRCKERKRIRHCKRIKYQVSVLAEQGQTLLLGCHSVASSAEPLDQSSVEMRWSAIYHVLAFADLG